MAFPQSKLLKTAPGSHETRKKMRRTGSHPHYRVPEYHQGTRHPSLLFAGLKLGEVDYLSTWESLEADPTTFEVLRNQPLPHPLLWVAQEDLVQ